MIPKLPALALLCLLAGRADADPFVEYLSTPFAPADGFDLPAAPAPGTPVRALAHGRVEAASQPGTLEVAHLLYENGGKRRVRAVYRCVEAASTERLAHVRRGEALGRWGTCPAPARGVELLDDGPPAAVDPAAQIELRRFVAARGSLPLPAAEPFLLLVDPSTFQLRVYEAGREVKRYEVGFGQAAGPKRRRGDLRTPVGMYFVLEKSRGPFAGDFAAFYGGHWIRLNYPNAFDAERGARSGLIGAALVEPISRAWRERERTNERTKLGGGIGFHGWANDWTLEASGGRLSWGCIVFHTRDLAELFPTVPKGAMVVILE